LNHEDRDDHKIGDIQRPFDWAAKRPDVMYETADTSRCESSAVCIRSLVHHGCRRATRADQSNGPSFVSVSSFLL